MTPFDQAFAILIGEEGGYSTDPRDPGNWTGGNCGLGVCAGTKYGLSAAAFPTLDIGTLTPDAARAIYLGSYWTPMHGDALPPVVALVAFDAAVNNGVGMSTIWLQSAAGVRVDGDIGPVTIAAAERADPTTLATEMLALRMVHMASIPGWSTFGLGWARRLCGLPFKAMDMAA